MHYKIREEERAKYNELVALLADRLFAEDKAAVAIRNILQKEKGEMQRNGFKDR